MYVRNKGNVVLDTYLDFDDVSSYLTFKLSTRKRGRTIVVSFEL